MPAPRISLTAKQLETAMGIDLLALCQRVTSDGSVTPAEADELRKWLDECSSIELPAIGYLRGTVERILEDGRVTNEELKELHRAIEKVLPPEHRVVSSTLRKDREQSEKEKNRALARLDSMVAGVTFEGRAYVVHKHASEGDRVYLVRDRNNVYSKAAIEVRLSNGMQVGYVPDEEAQELAPLLDSGAMHQAWIKKIWPGRRVDVPIIYGVLYRADAEVDDCVSEKDCPPKVSVPAKYEALAQTVMREMNDSERRSAQPTAPRGGGCALLSLGLGILLAIVVGVAMLL